MLASGALAALSRSSLVLLGTGLFEVSFSVWGPGEVTPALWLMAGFEERLPHCSAHWPLTPPGAESSSAHQGCGMQQVLGAVRP